VCLVVITLALCGCSNGQPWWYHKGVTMCGTPALIRVAGRVKALGNCAAMFVIPPPVVTLRVGQQLDVHVLQDSNRVPVYPLPRSASVSVLARVDVSADRSTASYRAVHPGHTALITRASCLVASTDRSTSTPWCPILDVNVIP